MKFKKVTTAIQSPYDARLEVDLNHYEGVYGYRSMRIRPVIEREGWIAAIEKTVAKSTNSSAYIKLIELNLTHMAWESFVLDNRLLFSQKCINNAIARLGAVQ